MNLPHDLPGRHPAKDVMPPSIPSGWSRTTVTPWRFQVRRPCSAISTMPNFVTLDEQRGSSRTVILFGSSRKTNKGRRSHSGLRTRWATNPFSSIWSMSAEAASRFFRLPGIHGSGKTAGSVGSVSIQGKMSHHPILCSGRGQCRTGITCAVTATRRVFPRAIPTHPTLSPADGVKLRMAAKAATALVRHMSRNEKHQDPKFPTIHGSVCRERRRPRWTSAAHATRVASVSGKRRPVKGCSKQCWKRGDRSFHRMVCISSMDRFAKRSLKSDRSCRARWPRKACVVPIVTIRIPRG